MHLDASCIFCLSLLSRGGRWQKQAKASSLHCHISEHEASTPRSRGRLHQGAPRSWGRLHQGAGGGCTMASVMVMMAEASGIRVLESFYALQLPHLLGLGLRHRSSPGHPCQQESSQLRHPLTWPPAYKPPTFFPCPTQSASRCSDRPPGMMTLQQCVSSQCVLPSVICMTRTSDQARASKQEQNGTSE